MIPGWPNVGHRNARLQDRYRAGADVQAGDPGIR